MSNRETSESRQQFNHAFQQHDLALLDEIIAVDCIIENTLPAPSGRLLVGREACLANWQGLAAARDTSFDLEEVFVAGERTVIRWRYWWGEGKLHSVQEVNLMRVRDGQVVEATGSVKGQ